MVTTMEDLLSEVILRMDLNGKDQAPQYNANQHIQIFLFFLFLVVGIITLNFLVSAVLINYRKAKEDISGEKDLTSLEEQWLTLKTYILSLEPEKKERLPINCFRRILYQVCTHWIYKIFQGVMLVSFMILAAACGNTDSERLFWQIMSLYIALTLLDYAAKLIAFGY